MVEMITISNEYETIYLIIGCDLFFSVWGIVICVSFITAGYLLLKSIGIGNRESGLDNLEQNGKENNSQEKRYTNASRLGSRRFTFTRRQSSNMFTKRKGVEHRQRAMMKVTIVTCVTAFLGIAYSLLSTANVAMAMNLLFQKECVNTAKGNRVVWLLLQYLARFLELLLGFLLLYAVADTTKMMKYLFKKWKKLGCGDQDDSTDLNTTDYDKSMSELETSTSERTVPVLGTIKAKSQDEKNQCTTRLESVTEETIHVTDNGKTVENGTIKNGVIESGSLESGSTENGSTENGTHQSLLRHQTSGPLSIQSNKNNGFLDVKHLLPKSHSDSSIMPNGKQKKYCSSSNEIV